MSLTEHVLPDVVILEPGERLTVETEEGLWHAVRRHISAGRTRLILDLAHVPAIDSCGLGAIVSAHVSAWRRGGGMKLVNLNSRHQRLFAITRLSSVLEVCESVDAARRSFGIRGTQSIETRA